MQPEPNKITSMYDYLRTESPQLQQADTAFVFCRADPLVAKRVAELYGKNLVHYIMVTGGVGKDSGALVQLGLPEAVYQAALLGWVHGIHLSKVFVEKNARNGAENSRLGIETIIENNLPHNELIIVVHPTSLRRTMAVHEVIAQEKDFHAHYQSTGTGYHFEPANPVDQAEAMDELLRLADWPLRGWCTRQQDLPMDLVEYARKTLPSLKG